MIVIAGAMLLAAQSAAGPDAAARPEKKICRTVSATGSRMGASRDCRTKAEWAAVDRRTGDSRRQDETMDPQGMGGIERQTPF